MKNIIKHLAYFSILPLFSCTRVLFTNKSVAGDCYQKTQDLAERSEPKLKQKTSDSTDSSLKNIITPLPNSFAHNDYCHKRPLLDALENGFTHIEADIFLTNGKLIVAHVFPFFKGQKTLEALYLQPLSERATRYNGNVFPGYNTPVILVIDIKTNAYKTYNALKPVLEKYKSILSGYQNGEVVYRAVTIVLTGNKPYTPIKNEQNRLAFIDEDLRKVNGNPVDKNVFYMASCKYSDMLKWNGKGTIPASEKIKLCAFVAMGHKMGIKVRLWASPENEAIWDELLDCGIDLINTDQLITLKNYLILKQPQKPIDQDIKLSMAEVR